MSKKAWLNPRKKKLIKGFTRSGKKGVQIVEPHLHDYPHADKDKLKKKNKKGENEESLNRDKNLKDKDTLKPSDEKRKEDIDKAKDELACELGV